MSLLSQFRPATGAWVRPSDWLPLPDIQPPTEGIAALVAVSEDGYGNLVSLKMTISDSATWTVDWGDGSTPEVIASGATATHDYAWADVGDVTSEGWRQAVLTVTPASGKTFATINLAAPVAAGVRNTGYSSPYIDIICSANATEELKVSDGYAVRTAIAGMLRTFVWQSSASPACFPQLTGCGGLLQLSLPEITGPVTAATYALSATQLRSAPAGLQYCSTLAHCFRNSASPAEDIALDFGGRGCNFSYMFFYSSRLRSFAVVNRSSGDIAYAFNSCYSVRSISLNAIFGAASQAFASARLLEELIVADASGITGSSGMLAGCVALEKLILTGLTLGVSVANCNLSAAALNAFFTSLGTASGAQTITITGNPGAGTCDTSIATAKGYTMVN